MQPRYSFLLLSMTVMTFSVHSAIISGSVVNRQHTAIAGATVTLQPEGITTTTDSDGKFSFNLGTPSKQSTNQVKTARNIPVLSSGRLYLNFDKQTTVTIQAFSLQGQTLATSTSIVPEKIPLIYHATVQVFTFTVYKPEHNLLSLKAHHFLQVEV